MTNLRIQLEPRGIATCPAPDVPAEVLAAFEHGMLQHQVDLYLAAKEHDIVLDIAPTGTGKTAAGLSAITHNPNRNAVYIAPTNALIAQQTEAAKDFVAKVGLRHVVKAASAQQVREWRGDRVGDRPGEKIYNALREPATMFPECGENRPLLLVTNPDIFYYAAFFQYGTKDRSNIASEFYSGFSTIIFDEFHLYDAKQLVSLLFYLTLSKVFGYFEHNRKIVLLTATPEPACEAALSVLQSAGVRIKAVDGQGEKEEQTPSQTGVDVEMRPYPDKSSVIEEISSAVVSRLQTQPDKYGAVILDSKDTLGQISDRLRSLGYEDNCGRITGDTPSEQRHRAAQKQVILATSTVDVGFNFEREIAPERQNLDWLIFSSRDRFSFWQRIGRVGRVLGKSLTDIPSEAIAYLPEKAWEQGIETLNCEGGRAALQSMLESLDCMKRPFLEIYWRSEAFLEIARPLLELEDLLQGLEQAGLVEELYQTMQKLFGGSKPWWHYRKEMQMIAIAEELSRVPVEPTKNDQWPFAKVLLKKPISQRRKFIRLFLEIRHPEVIEALNRHELEILDIEERIEEDEIIAIEVKAFCEFWKVVWSPIFRFRENLLPNLNVQDPHQFLIDETGEVNLDPFHLLRFYEFVFDDTQIELTARAEQPYLLSFSLLVDNLEVFKSTKLSKLWAFEHMSIQRSVDGKTVRPTDLPEALRKALSDFLVPGMVVKEHGANQWAIAKLKKLGLECYPIRVSSLSSSRTEDYTFFPSLSGILAIATAGVALKSPDNSEFWIA